MVARARGAATEQFRVKYVCSQCGYVKQFAERTCPVCGGPIIEKIVKRESYRKVIVA